MEKNKEKFKILFVCTGNSCRSPMAEGILKKMLKENKLDNFEVSSAGTFSVNGALPTLFAMEVTKTRSVDLTQHRSHQLNGQTLRKADLILVMSNEHLEHIRKMDKKTVEKTYLLKTFPQNHPTTQPEAPAPPKAGDLSMPEDKDRSQSVWYIKDPMGGSMDDYTQCFLEIEKEIRRIFPELIRKADEKKFKNRCS